jgi:hypothetical protein
MSVILLRWNHPDRAGFGVTTSRCKRLQIIDYRLPASKLPDARQGLQNLDLADHSGVGWHALQSIAAMLGPRPKNGDPECLKKRSKATQSLQSAPTVYS